MVHKDKNDEVCSVLLGLQYGLHEKNTILESPAQRANAQGDLSCVKALCFL